MINLLASKLVCSEEVGGVEVVEAEVQGLAWLASIHKEPKVPSMTLCEEEDHKASLYSSLGRPEETAGSSWRPGGARSERG